MENSMYASFKGPDAETAAQAEAGVSPRRSATSTSIRVLVLVATITGVAVWTYGASHVAPSGTDAPSAAVDVPQFNLQQFIDDAHARFVQSEHAEHAEKRSSREATHRRRQAEAEKLPKSKHGKVRVNKDHVHKGHGSRKKEAVHSTAQKRQAKTAKSSMSIAEMNAAFAAKAEAKRGRLEASEQARRGVHHEHHSAHHEAAPQRMHAAAAAAPELPEHRRAAGADLSFPHANSSWEDMVKADMARTGVGSVGGGGMLPDGFERPQQQQHVNMRAPLVPDGVPLPHSSESLDGDHSGGHHHKRRQGEDETGNGKHGKHRVSKHHAEHQHEEKAAGGSVTHGSRMSEVESAIQKQERKLQNSEAHDHIVEMNKEFAAAATLKRQHLQQMAQRQRMKAEMMNRRHH